MKNNISWDLAEASFIGKNFDKSYDNFKKLLEDGIDFKDVWICFGISAGFKSQDKNILIDEAFVYIKKGIDKNEVMRMKEEIISKYFIEMISHNLNCFFDLISEKSNELKMKPYADEELRASNTMFQGAFFRALFEKNKTIYFNIIEKSHLIFLLTNSANNCKNLIDVIDEFIRKSSGNIPNDIYKDILYERQCIVEKIQNFDISFDSQPPSNSSCLITTALSGSSTSILVLDFKYFRDLILRNYIFGRFFIYIYNSISPIIVKLMRNKVYIENLFRYIIVKNIYPVVKNIIIKHKNNF